MDAKEIKSALKKIKEYLDAKDYKSAIKQCKVILKADRNNYLALVFFGAALQETEQCEEAPKAFKKAIEISPEQLLAWRGLASFYDKNENGKYQKELLNVYSKLIILETDISKCSELIKKYEKLAVDVGDLIDINDFQLDEISNSEKQLMIKGCLVSIILNLPSISDDSLSYYSDFASEILSSKPLIENHLDLSKKYLKMLYKHQNIAKLFSEAKMLQTMYPKELFPLEWICKAYTEIPLENLQNIEFSPKEAYSSLLQSVPDSYLGLLCRGIHELHINDIPNALDTFKQVVTVKPLFGLSWHLLCHCQITLYQFPEAEYSARKALECFEKNEKNEANILKCQIWLIRSLSEDDSEDKLNEAVKLGNEFYTNNNDLHLIPHLIKAFIKLKNNDAEIKNYLEILKNNEGYSGEIKYLNAQILRSQNNLLECQRELEKLVEEHPDYFEAWLELGKIYYENKNNSCLSSLLKSTKLNHWCYWNFLYLGHCYRHMIHDLDKARRCYQKAFQLNPKSEEAGMCLSDIYRNLKKEDLNLQLLSAATSQTYGSKWAWLRLGLHYLSINKLQDAVNSLRSAVRLDPNDKNSWESLGDAYLATGAYTSALKSYQRVNELDDQLIYPLLQIATIKLLIGSYTESVNEFRIVLERNPDYLPGLKGHAEACLSLVKYNLIQNLNGLAGDLCQEAVNSLVRCLSMRMDLICIWKLLGDICVLFSGLQDKYCRLKIAAWLSNEANGDNKKAIELGREEILKLGIRSYCQAITLSPKTSSLWYDLAVGYNSLVKFKNNLEDRKEVLALALSAVKKFLQLDNRNWEGWNLLGVINASEDIKNYSLAQHAFIKSITLNDTSAQAWTNLGTLYLYLEELQLANQSFGEAQRCDHDYVQCWVGQALIAEKLDHHDAMDLFRHSTQLGFHQEGSLGYANLVCKTLLDAKDKTDRNYIYSINNMNAISVACDSMTWYTDRVTDHPCSLNMLGLLLERQNLYVSSFEAFCKSLNLLENRKNEEDQSDVIDMILLNCGRLMLSLKKYDEALSYLKRIKKANFVNQCGLAFSYFKAGLYEEAYSSYETTLEWLAPDGGFRSHILVAMATVVYMHQGQEDAKILLMQACQLKPPSVQGLFALCALGMLHSDLALSELSLKELSQHEDDPRYLSHIAVFRAYICLFKGKKDDAVRTLSKAVHKHPDQPSLWLGLCLLLLHLYPSCDSRVAARCAEVTMRTGKSSIDVSKVMSLVSLSNLLSGEGLLSLRSAQKAVHMFPYVTENWIVLIASVLSKCLARESVKEVLWLKKCITYVRRKLEASKPMTQWLSNNDRKVCLMADKLGYGCPVIEVEPSYFRIDHENI